MNDRPTNDRTTATIKQNSIPRKKEHIEPMHDFEWLIICVMAVILTAIIAWNLGDRYPKDVNISIKAENESGDEWNSFEFSISDLENNKTATITSEDLHNQMVVKVNVK